MELQSAKPRAKIEQWRQIIYQCRNSEQKISKWCQEHQIARQTCYHWQQEVWANENGRRVYPQKTATERTSARFTEIRIPTPVNECRLNVETPNLVIHKDGWSLEIRNGADPELLGQILRLVDEHV